MQKHVTFLMAAMICGASSFAEDSADSARAEPPADGSIPFPVTKPALDIGLVISDEAKAKEFYGDVLGLKFLPGMLPLPDGGKMIRYQAGPTTVKLLIYLETPPKHPGGINNAIGIRLLTLFSADLDPISDRAVERGMERPAILGGGGKSGRLMFINDQDGNQIELIEAIRPEVLDAPDPTDRSMIGLTVKDAEKSREFYGKVLGLKELPSRPLFNTSGPMKYSFAAGKTVIKFWQFDRELPAHTGPWKDAVGLRYLTFMVKDVDAVYEEIKPRGANVFFPPQVFGGLARIMLVADPDGNTIEFAQIGGRR